MNNNKSIAQLNNAPMNNNNSIEELLEENDALRTKMNMYERKVRRLRRTLGEYMNKYES